MNSLEVYRREALAFVNRIRIEHGQDELDDLRPGELSKAETCTISASLSELGNVRTMTRVTLFDWVDEDGEPDIYPIDVSSPVSFFMNNFDNGNYPDLILWEALVEA